MDATEDVAETLIRLQDEISSLESTKSILVFQLKSIDSSLSHLKARYGTAKNRIAPVGSLPNEILAKIFESGRDLNIPGGKRFEVLVSHVTTVWREVATNTPSLWNVLEIAPSTSSEMLSYCISRAKACSLDLKFDFLQEIWVPDQSIWDLILPSVERWRSLEILVYNEAALYTTLAHLEPFEAPLLEEITITRQNSTRILPVVSQTHGFRNSGRFFHAGAPPIKKAAHGRVSSLIMASSIPFNQSVSSRPPKIYAAKLEQIPGSPLIITATVSSIHPWRCSFRQTTLEFGN
ncbi:F-box domain-containing protein [Mycena venus]|uniref:F-box domain-containing protein n=1 Tax=Mycena venus TaxID=2733690 RepID=A0A8H6Y8G9_9AGAR|nr:F-box domain-containing protein [Mycena venus]